MLVKKPRKICLPVILVLIACCSCYCTAHSQINHQYIITKQLIGMEDGLCAREAYCGLQNSKGFIWFGTRNGLNRYDGKAMLLFTKRNSKMQENNVVKLASDMDNQLFVLYGQSGYSRLPIGKVDVLDENTLQVKSLTETFNTLPFKETDVYWIANDGTERINIMTKAPFRLWEYTKKNGFKLRLEMKAWDSQMYKYNVPSGALNYFYKEIACLGFGGHKKQYIINSAGQRPSYEMLATNYRVINTNSNKGVLLWQNDSNKHNAGLYLINAKGQLMPDVPSNVLKNAIANVSAPINVSGDTTCLFNIKGKGLFYYNNVSLIRLLAPSEIKDYAGLICFESFTDKLGNVWICSSGGIYKIKIKKNNFRQYFTKEQQKLEVNNQARGIWVDKQGIIYANVLKHLFIQDRLAKMKSIQGPDIKYAFINHADKSYITGKEVYEYLPSENKLKIVPGANNDRYILSAIFLNDSIMLLGKTEQVFAFNIRSNSIKQIQAPNGSIILPYRFLKRKDGTVWIAGENGLFLLNSKTEIVDYFCVGNKKPGHELPIDNLTDAFEDEMGTLWLTTNGDGLYKWNRANNSFKHYGLEQGMPSSILYRIEEDGNQNLWISSENGLVCFNPNNGVTNVFLEKDGLSHNEFNRLSSYKDEDGRLFFGGLNGINAFYPREISKTTNTDAPLRVISYHQFREEEEKLVDLTANLLQENKILLKPDDEFFILEFRLLDFENKVNHYAYKLEGVDKDWVYTTENTIRFSGLPHGKFTLLVKSQTPDGQWSRQQLEIPVEVQVPFYKKGWAQLLFAGMIIIGFVMFFKYRTNRLKKDKLALEQAVAARTALLQKTLTEKELLLKEIHHRVKNNLQIISGLLDLQKDEIADDGSKAIFNEGQSRVKSIALIHQSLYQNDNLAEIKLAPFVKELVSQVAGVFEKASSTMQIEMDIPEMVLDIDNAVPLGLIVNELLTNAFKYAVTKTSKVQIHIKVKQKESDIYLLTFSDNGPGIKQDIDFDMASTLGLRLIKGLAAQLNGAADYCYNNGSTFLITFKVNG